MQKPAAVTLLAEVPYRLCCLPLSGVPQTWLPRPTWFSFNVFASTPAPSSGDAVWKDRRQRVHSGLPVPLLSCAGLCGCPGQRNSAPQVKRQLVVQRETKDPFQRGPVQMLEEPEWGAGAWGTRRQEPTGNVCQAQGRALTFSVVISLGFYYSLLSFFFLFNQQNRVQRVVYRSKGARHLVFF